MTVPPLRQRAMGAGVAARAPVAAGHQPRPSSSASYYIREAALVQAAGPERARAVRVPVLHNTTLDGAQTHQQRSKGVRTRQYPRLSRDAGTVALRVVWRVASRPS